MASKPFSTNMSPQEYLEFEEKSEVRHEYVEGIVYEMPGESKEHNRIAGRIYRFLPESKGECWVAFEGIKLWIAHLNRYYYPDVMALCDPRDNNSHVFEYPCFIAEVLSPSTEGTDRREKLSAYRSIETLQTYLIVDPETQQAELYRRSKNWERESLSNGDVQVECLEASLRLEDLFA